MNERYAKSDAGRAEIRARALPLARPARNLLLILDASKDAADWLAAVQGATAADLESLLSQGLLEPAAGGLSHDAGTSFQGSAGTAAFKDDAAKADAGKAARPQHDSRDGLLQALQTLPHAALYDLLTAQAKARFGLLKGYRLVLDIERCTDLPALQAVAGRFVEQLAKEQGESGLGALRSALPSQPMPLSPIGTPS